MKNQISVSDQNTQQVGQNSINQTVQIPEQSRVSLKGVGIIIFVCLVIFSIGGFFLWKKLLTPKQNFDGRQNQTIPSPTATENEVTASWKIYNSIDNSIMFKYPEDWQVGKEGIFGSRTVTEFKYNNTPLFELTVQGNYNQVTGKPYTNLVEFLGQRLNKSRDILVDEQSAKRIEDQGDQGHVIPYEEVIVFAPDNKTIVSLYYKSSYYDKPTANRVLDQILLTFKFLKKSAPDSVLYNTR